VREDVKRKEEGREGNEKNGISEEEWREAKGGSRGEGKGRKGGRGMGVAFPYTSFSTK